MVILSNDEMQLLASSGIAWDISGAIALSRSWFCVGDEKLKRQAGSYYGSNPATGRAYAEQRLDTRFGLMMLIFGFSMQFLSAFGIDAPASIACALIAGIPIAWVIYLSNYKYWVTEMGLKLSICEGAQEHTWKEHYKDVPDRIWKRAVINGDINFTRKN